MRQPSPLPSVLLVLLCLLAGRTAAQDEYQEFLTAPAGDSISTFDSYHTPDGGTYAHLKCAENGWTEEKFIRVDASGVPQWAKTLHFTTDLGSASFGRLAVTPDNGALFWSIGQVHALGVSDLISKRVLVKLDAQWQVEWAREFLGPAQHASFMSAVPNANTFSVFPDGSSVLATIWDVNTGYELEIIKFDSDGIPLWSMLHPFQWGGGWGLGDLVPNMATLADGGVALAFGNDDGFLPGASADVLKVDNAGQLLWHRHYVLNNAPWTIGLLNIVAHENGNFLVHGYREDMDSYSFLMWFDSGGELYRHRLAAWEDYPWLTAWRDDGIWSGNVARDTTGGSVLGGYGMQAPGTFGNYEHSFWTVDYHVGLDSIWVSGRYEVTDLVFGYTEYKPFVLCSARSPLSACRLQAVPGQAINYIDVPDSLLSFTTETQFTTGAVTYADVDMTVVDRPLGTTYDFCTIVSVDETISANVGVQLWPDPLEQGEVLHLQCEKASDLTILDAQGRVALQLNDRRTARQVSTSALGTGTYIAMGRDQHGARLWSRAFVVR